MIGLLTHALAVRLNRFQTMLHTFRNFSYTEHYQAFYISYKQSPNGTYC